MFNQDVSKEVSVQGNTTDNFKVPFELLKNQLGKTLFEVSRLPVQSGLLQTGNISLAKLLARRCGYSLRTARRHIRRLELAGLITRQTSITAAGMQSVNLYQRRFN
ncbi:winged helix-turn-helix transcriptional regulator [Shewanella algae]|uniref:winged helix-turn-helix transcriptional regulator n=1 Tax=Shewanella algae TaxID=38313 RepID=UPI0030052D0E